MAPPLKWAIWALAVSHTVGEEAAKLVKWEDLMTATSRFPRFFGSPAHISRTDPPKVVAMSIKYPDGHRQIEPVHCSSDSGSFSCTPDCVNCHRPSDTVLSAYSALRERNSSLSHHLDGLDLVHDYSLFEYYPGHTYERFFFTQTLAGLVPIDNSQVVLSMNKNDTNGYLWFAPEPGRTFHKVYTGEFDHDSTEPTCSKFYARDTAALVAFNQPTWYGLYPEHMQADTVYTVQDGRLYLAWRLKFNLKSEVDDDFYVWVNARNCSEVVAAASAKMDPYVSSLEGFKSELGRLFKEERGIDLGEGQSLSE